MLYHADTTRPVIRRRCWIASSAARQGRAEELTFSHLYLPNRCCSVDVDDFINVADIFDMDIFDTILFRQSVMFWTAFF